MTDSIIIPAPRQLQTAGLDAVPAVIADAGEQATRRFIEFFTAHIRNKNTRRNYGQAAQRFSDWCDRHRLPLDQLNPVLVAAYVEEIGRKMAAPTVKLHLAAIRMLFDYLVTGG